MKAISDSGLGFALTAVDRGDALMEMDIGSVYGGSPDTKGQLVPRNIDVSATVDAEFVLAS